MKILMTGLGSIGQRHVRNLRKLYGNEVELIAFRSRGLKTTFSDDLKIREGVDLEAEYGITPYYKLEEALAQKPDAAFITNITSRHMETALACAKAGCHMLIEKPLSHDMEGAEELGRIAKEKGLKIFMGFQNRYHPSVQRMKESFESGELGNPVYGSCEFSERVITMHRYEDYRDTYMAQKKMGGGPVLNLQMHDLDILQWILGRPLEVSAQLKYSSGLEIDVEESAQAVFTYKGGMPVYAHTDFIQYPPVHCFKIAGDHGRIEADLIAARTVKYIGDEPAQVWEEKDFIRNDMFIEELKDFFDCIKHDREPKIPLEAGIVSLKMALAMKRSAESRKTEQI